MKKTPVIPEKKQNAAKPQQKTQEKANLIFSSSLKIHDPDSKTVLVQMRCS
jgi:hypothetical protein